MNAADVAMNKEEDIAEVNMEMTTTNAATATAAVAASLPSISLLEPVPIGFLNAQNTMAGIQAAIKYIDKLFEYRGVRERFATLQAEHVVNDHLQIMFGHLFSWFARTSFEVNTPSGYMVTSGKETKYKQMKSAFQKQFPSHPLFKDESYWSAMNSQFKKMCSNFKITNTDMFEARTQVPLYRIIDDTLIRQKYRGDSTSLVDALAVSFSFIVNGSKNSCHKLAEQNLSRNAVGRGGEHRHIRYSETYWDEYFRAADLDWPIIKQSDTKCSLHFCDFNEPYLCSFFGLGVFFLSGGLRRSGVNDAVVDYFFPDLFNVQPNAVAKNLSNSISQHVKVKYGTEKACEITTRSSRKGSMTEARANRDLDRSHEYARSGHTGPECNAVSVWYLVILFLIHCRILPDISSYYLLLRMQRVIFKLLLQ